MKKILLAVLLGVLAAPVLVEGQIRGTQNPQGLIMERAELAALLDELEGVTGSSAYSRRMRDEAEQDAAIIRSRLESGDFRLGDWVSLTVDGEPTLTGDFPVEGGPRLTLPGLGAITLEGVLRSELEMHLTKELGRFIQNPVVRAVPRVRLSIQGAVGNPGFFTVPADMLLSEFLMFAGGPAGNANLEDMRIERVGARLWEGDELRVVLAEGRTLDQLNIRGGDEVLVPARNPNPVWGRALRWGVGLATTLAFGVRVFF